MTRTRQRRVRRLANKLSRHMRFRWKDIGAGAEVRENSRARAWKNATMMCKFDAFVRKYGAPY